MGSGVLPLAVLECLACGGNGNVDILLGGLVNRADDLLCGWVDDLKGLAVGALLEFVVDEAVGDMSGLFSGLGDE